MARTPLTRTQKFKTEVKSKAKLIENLLNAAGFTKKELADLVELTPQAVSNQFSNESLTLEVYLGAIDLAQGRIKEIKDLLEKLPEV